MYSNPIKKLFGLFILYASIIIGIFVLQFKSESIISESIGAMHLLLSKTQAIPQAEIQSSSISNNELKNPTESTVSAEISEVNSTDETIVENNSDSISIDSLKNSLQADFNGIQFYFDDSNPVLLTRKSSKSGSTVEDITLISWTKASALSSIFEFTEGVHLTFSVSDESEDALLSIMADLPEDAESVSINFKPRKGFQVTDKNASRITLESSSNKFQLSGDEIMGDRVLISKNSSIFYTAAVESKKFTFDNSNSYDLASARTYSQNLQILSTNVVKLFDEALNNNTMVTEAAVLSYVAEMAKNGRYTEAINKVPDSFRRGQRRTYLSAPYFNNLARMYTSLEMHETNLQRLANQAIAQNSCDIFTIPNITDYILMNRKSALTQRILKIVENSNVEKLSTLQAAGMLNFYLTLSEFAPDTAKILEESVQKKFGSSIFDTCLGILEESCKIREDGVKIQVEEIAITNTNTIAGTGTDAGGQISALQAIEIGNALVRYGEKVKNQQVAETGYFIVNSYFTEINTNDFHTCSELYPDLIRNNPYYPHFEILGQYNGNDVWAWTCSPEISCTSSNSTNLELSIQFPQELTHYVIIGGIPEFTRINIYGMAFRTDPRFETYNSSGYVRLRDSNTLLLKSRHRREIESIILTFARPASSSAQNTTSRQTTSSASTTQNTTSRQTRPAAATQSESTQTSAAQSSNSTQTPAPTPQVEEESEEVENEPPPPTGLYYSDY